MTCGRSGMVSNPISRPNLFCSKFLASILQLDYSRSRKIADYNRAFSSAACAKLLTSPAGKAQSDVNFRAALNPTGPFAQSEDR